MHNQFYQGIKVSRLIDQLKPKLILEIGFGAGTNLMMLLCYTKKPGNDYRVISLSDDSKLPDITLPNDFVSRFLYVAGVSYNVIPYWRDLKLPDEFSGPIDFCIIDSDHNYFTLKNELFSINTIMAERCAIAIHDTASQPCEHHRHYANALNEKSNSMIQDTGYKDKSTYPMQQVLETWDVPMMEAIDEFLLDHRDYDKLVHLDECCGCTLVGRGFEYAV